MVAKTEFDAAFQNMYIMQIEINFHLSHRWIKEIIVIA